MSDTGNPFGFGKLVPGFDFLQNLVDSANKGLSKSGSSSAGLSSWIAPTLNVEELDKRISELKAVNFWLEQNSRALGATIQALEVQKMTLSTLKGMNFAMGDVANAFKIKSADAAPAKSTEKAAEPSAAKAAATSYAKSFESPAAEAMPATAPQTAGAAANDSTAAGGAAPGGGTVDPMQWWNALTGQFQQIAANAMRDAASNPALEATRTMTTSAMNAANEMKASMAGTARKAAANAGSGSATPASKTAARKTARKAAKKSTARKAPAKKSPDNG